MLNTGRGTGKLESRNFLHKSISVDFTDSLGLEQGLCELGLSEDIRKKRLATVQVDGFADNAKRQKHTVPRTSGFVGSNLQRCDLDEALRAWMKHLQAWQVPNHGIHPVQVLYAEDEPSSSAAGEVVKCDQVLGQRWPFAVAHGLLGGRAGSAGCDCRELVQNGPSFVETIDVEKGVEM